ncbi:hypothetical protein HDU98_000569 [Podochytrium sp. JEL0797]|nr:hypothetical protein HDU98_000569 [Podochytrium sp. JEL0797]
MNSSYHAPQHTRRQAQLTPARADLSMAHLPNSTLIENFFGFVKDRYDASILVEACVTGLLDPIVNLPLVISGLYIRSGTVIVFPEQNQAQMSRWRDGGMWSSSRVSSSGNSSRLSSCSSSSFLLYREIEKIGKGPVRGQGRHAPDAGSVFSATTRFPNGLKLNRSDAPSVESDLFSTSSLRKNTRMVPNGMAKRTISMTGSDGKRYRVISYFYPSDVEHHYTKNVTTTPAPPGMLLTPSQIPEFQHLRQQLFSGQNRNPTPPLPTPSPSRQSKTLRRSPSMPASNSLQLPSFASGFPEFLPSPPPSRELIYQGSSPETHMLGKLHLDEHLTWLSRNPEWSKSPVVLTPLKTIF